MNKSESINELAAALVKAQQTFGPIRRDKTVKVKTRTGGEYTFSYAPLESILDAIRTPLFDNGLSIVQEVVEDRVVTTIMHSSGQFWSTAGTPIKVSEGTAQAYGSGMTYARRYDLSLALFLCADDDDDGNGADGNQATNTKKIVPTPITPTTGCWENVPEERHETLHRLAEGVVEMFSMGALEDAYTYLYVENVDPRNITNEEFLCVWDALKPHSKIRNTLKKMRDERRKEAA